MKYYVRIFVPDFEVIRTKTDQFLDKMQWRPKIGFHALPWGEYVDHCPEILTAFDRLYGLKPVWAATYITYNNTHSKIHIDNKKPCQHDHECRISLPIRNCANTFTEFFTGGEYDEFHQPSGEKFFVIKENSVATKVDEVEMTGPTVMRVMEPHRVCHPHNSQRVNLTVYMDKDPVFLLD